MVDLRDELRLGHVDVRPSEVRAVEVRVPVDVRRALRQLGERHQVVGVVRIAERDVVERVLRQPRLEREDGVGGVFRRRPSGELQRALDVGAILLSRLDEARLGLHVVVAIGQPEAAGKDLRDGARRLVLIGERRESERHRHAEIVQTADHLLHVGCVLHRVDLGEQRGQRLHTRRIDRGLIHARRVVIADLLLDAAPRPVALGQLFEDVAETLLVDLAGLPSPAPSLHRRRDRVGGPPGAVGELEEIAARIGGAIEIGALDALAGDFRLFFRLWGGGRCASQGKQDEAVAGHLVSTKKRRVYFARKLYICAA